MKKNKNKKEKFKYKLVNYIKSYWFVKKLRLWHNLLKQEGDIEQEDNRSPYGMFLDWLLDYIIQYGILFTIALMCILSFEWYLLPFGAGIGLYIICETIRRIKQSI